MERKIRMGDIYLEVLKNAPTGSVQWTERLVVVIQSNSALDSSNTVIVAPITSVMKKSYNFVLEIKKSKDNNLDRDSYIQCNQIRTVNKSELTYYIGSLSGKDLSKLRKTISVTLGFNEEGRNFKINKLVRELNRLDGGIFYSSDTELREKLMRVKDIKLDILKSLASEEAYDYFYREMNLNSKGHL